MRDKTDTVTLERVLADLRRRVTIRLGAEFVGHQDDLIRCFASTTQRMFVQGHLDSRRRETWIRYLVEELFPSVPWVAAGGPGWEHVKDNPPKPSGWALAQLSGDSA